MISQSLKKSQVTLIMKLKISLLIMIIKKEKLNLFDFLPASVSWSHIQVFYIALPISPKSNIRIEV